MPPNHFANPFIPSIPCKSLHLLSLFPVSIFLFSSPSYWVNLLWYSLPPFFKWQISVLLNYSWHGFNKHLLTCFYLLGAQLGTRAGEVNEKGSPHSLKGDYRDLSPGKWWAWGALPTPQIQLFLSGELLRTYDEFPGQLEPKPASQGFGYLLKLGVAWANIFSRIPFSSQHFPFFLLWVPLLCPAVSLVPSQPAVFGKDLRFPWCAQVGICSWPRLSVPESSLLNEIMCVPTLCTRQTCERYLSSLFIPEEPRLKKKSRGFSVRWSTHSQSLCLFPCLSLHHLCWDWQVFQLMPNPLPQM